MHAAPNILVLYYFRVRTCYTFLASNSHILSMKLLGSLTCPFVRKVRVVMAEKKLDYELLLEDVWADDTIVQQYNPLGKIPCLIMDDYGSLFDSRVIVEYLDTLSPVSRLIPQSGRERATTKAWEAVADGLMDAAESIHVELTQRPTARQCSDWTNRQKNKILAALKHMEAELSSTQPYCTGNNLSLADLAVGCALGYLDLRFPDLDWRSECEKLAGLLTKLESRPSFQATTLDELTAN